MGRRTEGRKLILVPFVKVTSDSGKRGTQMKEGKKNQGLQKSVYRKPEVAPPEEDGPSVEGEWRS
jgi:hypothetical protein